MDGENLIDIKLSPEDREAFRQWQTEQQAKRRGNQPITAADLTAGPQYMTLPTFQEAE